MFDIGASELLMIVIVAIVVIGPKDMPMALRTAGRWIGKMRKISGHFRAGVDAMVREAELEEMERKWREQNEAIMKASPQLPTSLDDWQQPPTGEGSLSSNGQLGHSGINPPREGKVAGDGQQPPDFDHRPEHVHSGKSYESVSSNPSSSAP